ncbi:MAG: septal ring lytic transglycosylase RlpA family protein [Treponema sp.]|jgi:rare lipoprotein A|nr:septal ring lytic transglycosylase RlpA family protein [Treponema sp.]
MKRISILFAAGLFFTALCAAQTDTENFRQEGIASWYGKEFDGRPTSSGELFNSRLLTAAHPTLPFGTTVTVTNKNNGKMVSVKVNDRGPHVKNRIIDLSQAAAEQLDMITVGTAPVLVGLTQAGGKKAALQAKAALKTGLQTAKEDAGASPAVIRPAKPSPEETGKTYRIQVGAYTVPRYAVDAFDRLKAQGLNPAYEKNGNFFRVVLAGLKAGEIESVAEKLGRAGFTEALIREEN